MHTSPKKKSVSTPIIITINAILVGLAYYFVHFDLLFWILLIVSLSYGILNVTLLLTKGSTVGNFKPSWLHGFLYLSLPILLALLMVKFMHGFHWYLLYLFVVVWLCDVGAFFIGKSFGKKKLFLKVSPNKTWAGFFGGGLLSLIAAILIHSITGNLNYQTWLVLGFLIWLTSVMGDLIESYFKRSLEIKDTGTIIPGHGGFLDRLDSFIFALPFYAFLILIFAQ